MSAGSGAAVEAARPHALPRCRVAARFGCFASRGAGAAWAQECPGGPRLSATASTRARAASLSQAEPEAQIGHASAFAATSMGFSTVQSSCWYLDWNSQYLSRRSKAEDGCCGLQQGLLKIRWTDFYNHTADEGPLASRPSDRSKPQSPMLQALFRCPTTFPGCLEAVGAARWPWQGPGRVLERRDGTLERAD